MVREANGEAKLERDQIVMYGVNATGLSFGHRRVLSEIVEGLNAMR